MMPLSVPGLDEIPIGLFNAIGRRFGALRDARRAASVGPGLDGLSRGSCDARHSYLWPLVRVCSIKNGKSQIEARAFLEACRHLRRDERTDVGNHLSRGKVHRRKLE